MAEEAKIPLDIKNEEERRIILEGRKDPENFKMPDGRSLADHRKEKFETDTKEGMESEEIQRKRVRQQSIEQDPLYDPKNKVVLDEASGGLTIIPTGVTEVEDKKPKDEKPKAPPTPTPNPSTQVTGDVAITPPTK